MELLTGAPWITKISHFKMFWSAWDPAWFCIWEAVSSHAARFPVQTCRNSDWVLINGLKWPTDELCFKAQGSTWIWWFLFEEVCKNRRIRAARTQPSLRHGGGFALFKAIEEERRLSVSSSLVFSVSSCHIKSNRLHSVGFMNLFFFKSDKQDKNWTTVNENLQQTKALQHVCSVGSLFI